MLENKITTQSKKIVSEDHINPRTKRNEMHLLFLSTLVLLSPALYGQTENILRTTIRDLVIGRGASNVSIELYRQDDRKNAKDYDWIHVTSNVTDSSGSNSDVVTPSQFPPGDYKMVFHTQQYYVARNVSTFYPYLEIIFRKSSPDDILIVVSLSPYGYTFYKGVYGKK